MALTKDQLNSISASVSAITKQVAALKPQVAATVAPKKTSGSSSSKSSSSGTKQATPAQVEAVNRISKQVEQLKTQAQKVISEKSVASSKSKTLDVAATNEAREAAVAAGKDPKGVYVYKGEQAPATIKTSATSIADVKVPASLANDPYFKQLTPENQALVAYQASILESQDAAKAAAFKKALSLAGKQADPYWKQKINIFKDEFNRVIGAIDADLSSHEKNLIAQKSEVERALTVGKEDLSIDEQTELANEAKNLEAEILTTRDTMAARGLTSSTIKNQAEQKLNEASQYMVEGKKKLYDRNKRELEAKSAYNINEIERQINDVRRAANDEKVSATRKAEGYLGSSALSGTPNLMGNINGSIIEDKSADVLVRAKALMIQ